MIISLLIAGVVNSLSPDGKCRILAMKGGGVHGSYEVGVLKAFFENMDPQEFKYDIVSGVSAGSINAAVLAMYPPGQEKQALDELLQIYENHLPQDYWKAWSTIIFEPFWKKSIIDTSPFDTIFNDIFSGRSF